MQQQQQQLIHYSPFESIKVTNALWLNIYIMIDDKKIKVEQINKRENMKNLMFNTFFWFEI